MFDEKIGEEKSHDNFSLSMPSGQERGKSGHAFIARIAGGGDSCHEFEAGILI
jgi:hypothetical protein